MGLRSFRCRSRGLLSHCTTWRAKSVEKELLTTSHATSVSMNKASAHHVIVLARWHRGSMCVADLLILKIRLGLQASMKLPPRSWACLDRKSENWSRLQQRRVKLDERSSKRPSASATS